MREVAPEQGQRSAALGSAAEEPDGNVGALPSPAAAGPRETAREVWRRWRPSVVTGGWTWLAGLAMYAVVTFVAWLPMEGLPAKEPVPASLDAAHQAWYQWDTVWYVIIADRGYGYDARSTAFFPLYPLLIRGVNQLLPGGAFEAALLVSVLSCLAALILVHRLTAEILGVAVARRTTFYLLAFPTGFFLAAAYNESLFLALAVGSLYCMRRGRWWWAGLLAGFASVTRLTGVLLGVAFGYEYLRRRGFSPRRVRVDALAVVLVPAGLLLYAWYCARTFGDPLQFLTAQQSWFRNGYQAPWTTVREVIQLIVETPPVLGPTTVRNVINLGTALAVLTLSLLALVGPWRLGRDQAYLVIFAVLVILLPLVNPIRAHYPLSSMWRYALECTVAFMVLARMGRDGRFDRIYLTTALSLQGAMIVTFLQDQFVA